MMLPRHFLSQSRLKHRKSIKICTFHASTLLKNTHPLLNIHQYTIQTLHLGLYFYSSLGYYRTLTLLDKQVYNLTGMESPTRRETPLLESYSYQSTSTPITNINRTCSGITVDSEHNATFLSDYSNDIGQSRLCIKEIETPDTLPGYPGLGADDLKGTPHSTTSVDSGHHYHFSSQNNDDSKHPFTISSGMRPTSSNAPAFAASSIIRLINKDMTQQFHGRAPANSSSGAKIDWFGNRKAQVLGLCSTFAFLAIAIALSSYRWIGLIVGSINTICCGSAVVATYFRKKQWHQHPNPIIRNRAILGIFLAICLLLNVWLDYSVGSAHNEHCQRLAGMTEFFFFTSEAWGLVMACDLYFSVRLDCPST